MRRRCRQIVLGVPFPESETVTSATLNSALRQVRIVQSRSHGSESSVASTHRKIRCSSSITVAVRLFPHQSRSPEVQTFGNPLRNDSTGKDFLKTDEIGSDMHNRIVRIDPDHSRAISIEVAERLRMILAKEQSEVPSSLKSRIDRLRELDGDSASIVPLQTIRSN
jgi:hypothetical protein